MRVLQVNSIFNGGGVDNQTYELSRGLVAAGVETTLALSEGSRLQGLAERVPGMAVAVLPRKRLAFVRALIGLIRRQRPQIVHAQHGRDYWPVIIATWWARTGARVVVSRHLMGVVSAPSRRFLLRMTHVAAVSRAVWTVLDATLQGRRERLHLVYGGVDCKHFAPVSESTRVAAKSAYGWSAHAVVFAVLGFFNPPRGKGQLEFLRAATTVAAQCPEARFLVVGGGGLKPVMETMIADAGLASRCRIVNWVDDVRAVLAAVDVLVYPAVAPEALGIALWEAMACGLPVIGSALGGIPEAFVDREHGRLVPADDVPALAAAMGELAGDADRRRIWGAAARDHVVARFSTPAHVARMRQLYDTALSPSR